MPLKAGEPAPAFAAEDQDGHPVGSDDLAGKRYVLYFYPYDDTPICTRQALGFEDEREEFDRLEVPVFGVSPGSVGSHARFAKKHGLGFRLLADPERRLVRAFDVAGLLGRTARVTYLIGPDGRIEGVHRAELSGKGHARWARQQIERLGQTARTTA